MATEKKIEKDRIELATELKALAMEANLFSWYLLNQKVQMETMNRRHAKLKNSMQRIGYIKRQILKDNDSNRTT